MPKFEYKIYKKIFLLGIWISFFAIINLNPSKFLDYSIISKIRMIAPFLFFILILTFKYAYSKFYFKTNTYTLFFYCIFFSYALFIFSNPMNPLHNLFWPILMLMSFFILQIFSKKEELNFLLKLTFLIIAIGFTFYFSMALLDMYKHSNYHFYGVMGENLRYSNFEDPPRSSGLSRMSLLILTFFITYYMFKKKKKDYKILIVISVLAFITIVFQSRTTTFTYIVLIFLCCLFYFKKFFYDKRLIVFVLILPLIANVWYNYNLIKPQVKSTTKILNKDMDQKDILLFALQDSILRDQITSRKNIVDPYISDEIKINIFSSGRFFNWKKSYEIIKNKKYIGYGAQADRLIFNQSISNAFLYSSLSGGIFAGLSIVAIYIYSILMIIKLYFNKNIKLKNDYLSHLCSFILIILGLRSVLETSIAIFSIDYLTFIICFIYLNNIIFNYSSNNK